MGRVIIILLFVIICILSYMAFIKGRNKNGKRLSRSREEFDAEVDAIANKLKKKT